MKKQTYILILVALFFTAQVFAQKSADNNTKRWEIVNQLAEKQLPESALKEVEEILKQAQKDKNSTETIKALVYKMRFALEKNPEEAPKLLHDFEVFTEKTTDIAEKALLHSMTAELYAKFYQKDRWTINSRTQIIGVIPKDIKEWSKNLFYNKISDHLSASFEDTKELQKIDNKKFELLFEKGDDSKSLQPTFYDFLCYRKISILETLENITDIINPLLNESYYFDSQNFIHLVQDTLLKTSIESKIVNTYQQLIRFHSKSTNEDALLYADFNRLKYIKNHCQLSNSDSLYIQSLKQLKNKFIHNELIVEILAEIASYYIDTFNEGENILNYKIAHDICVNGIQQFPNYKRIGFLKNLKSTIETKRFSINYKSVVRKSDSLSIDVISKNISMLTLSVYRVNTSSVDYFNFKQNNQRRNEIFPNHTLIKTGDFEIKNNPNFGNTKSCIKIDVSDFGIYEFCLELKGNEKSEKRSVGTFTVTNLGTIERKTENKKGSIYVLDSESGQLQTDVNVEVWNRKWIGSNYSLVDVEHLKTDKNAYCQITDSTNSHNQFYFFQKGKDRFFSSYSSSYFSKNNINEYNSPEMSLFTDRSTYRPGQTIYFKGIAYYDTNNKKEVIKGEVYSVHLLDTNGKIIETKKVTTNEFGSFTSNFTLPTNGLNGLYSIRSKLTYKEIQVEKYKRPSFEVNIDKPKSELVFGERAEIKGSVKVFAGFGLGGTKVKYRIIQRQHRNCWWCLVPEKEICYGDTITKIDGTFSVNFVPKLLKTNRDIDRNNQFYTYTLYIEATNSNGETQQGEQEFSIGEKSLFILTTIADKIDKNRALNIPLSSETLNGEKVISIINYSLIRLNETDDYNENIKDTTTFKSTETALVGSFDTQNSSLNLELSKLLSGRYKMIFTTLDAHGKEVKTAKNFIIYSINDKKPPVKTYTWLIAPKTEFERNEKAYVQFGTSTKNSVVLYEIMQGNNILESKWINFSDEIITFNIPSKHSLKDGITVMFTFVKDNQCFTESIALKQKQIEKTLTPILSIFRNKLLPGEKAEWTITIPESSKSKNAAELLVGMYDASLDKFSTNNWNFNPTYSKPILYSPLWNYKKIELKHDNVILSIPRIEYESLQFNQLKWFGLNLNGSIYIRGSRSDRRFKAPVIVRDEQASEQVEMNAQVSVSSTNAAISIADVKVSDEISEKSHTKTKSITPRTNFNETAFFYPQLRTDSLGNVKFSFTVPESLTRWNVKMLAHTKDLDFGQGEAQVVTQKDLMVQMNLPRFVRRSDKLVLSANVVNLRDKELTSNVKIELIDPATEKNIQLKDAATRKVILAPNETKTVEWEITEFSPYELVTCKVIAEAGDFSDGEQKYLPILPDKVLVTESIPLILRGNENRSFNFDNLLQNGTKVDNKSLTVEFASNPTWYAIQALPSLSKPEGDNAFDYLTAYYANRLAGYIINSNPKIKSVVEQWKLKNGNREALLSNLEKNSELKNILLEETPWIMTAKNETEQKRQLAFLFDLNQQENQAQQYLTKLQSLQLPSGGFAWFKGMSESRYVTQAILLNLGRLKRIINGQWATDSGKQIVIKALAYLDLEIARDFENLKKHNKNYEKEHSIDNNQLFYLHLRSEFPEIEIAESAKDAVQFYTLQSEKKWTDFTLYGKAMMAVVAHRNGKIELANNILNSLKENALKSDELGMYWAKNQAGYFWNERPIAVQSAMIEAFAEVSKNQSDVEELKIWLLKQKQTQSWDSPLSTVDAVYALINYGSDWLKSDGKVNIKLGSTGIKSQSSEAGTGYFKQTIPTVEIQSAMGKVTISNQTQSTNSEKNSSIGWGAMYWQYYQSLEKITQQNGSLSISKKLHLEKMSQQGKQLVPIEQAKIKKGDKIITRLVITTDRSLEFVSLKDLRAACFEPVEQISGYFWKEGIGYYKSSKDASTQFFFSYLPKGTYVFEYELWANSAGDFSSGMATLQCLYAPEFISHSGGERVVISNLK